MTGGFARKRYAMLPAHENFRSRVVEPTEELVGPRLGSEKEDQMFRSLLIAVLAAVSHLVAAQATADQFCADRVTMISHLIQDYHESRTGIGLASSGSVIELFTADNGTWTILKTAPDGRTCVVGTGEAWESNRQPLPAVGATS